MFLFKFNDIYDDGSEDNSDSMYDSSLESGQLSQSPPEGSVAPMSAAAMAVVAKAHPNLMAQEMLRDMARMAMEQNLVKPEPGLTKMDAASAEGASIQRAEILAGLKVKALKSNEVAAANQTAQNGFYGNKAESKNGDAGKMMEIDSDLQIMSQTYGSRKAQTPPMRKKEPIRDDLRNSYHSNNNVHKGVKMEDRFTEETSGMRKPRKGTPVKLCATPPSSASAEDLSRTRRQIFTDMPSLDGPYEEGMASPTGSSTEEYDRLTIITDDKPTLNIGTMKVPIQPAHKESVHARTHLRSASTGKNSLQEKPPVAIETSLTTVVTTATNGATSTPQPLDLTSPVRETPSTAKQDILEAVSVSDATATVSQSQILLLNGKEYEIVPIGSNRWITRNEYEMMKELCEVQKSTVMSTGSPPERGKVSDGERTRHVPLRVPQIKPSLRSMASSHGTLKAEKEAKETTAESSRTLKAAAIIMNKTAEETKLSTSSSQASAFSDHSKTMSHEPKAGAMEVDQVMTASANQNAAKSSNNSNSDIKNNQSDSEQTSRELASPGKRSLAEDSSNVDSKRQKTDSKKEETIDASTMAAKENTGKSANQDTDDKDAVSISNQEGLVEGEEEGSKENHPVPSNQNSDLEDLGEDTAKLLAGGGKGGVLGFPLLKQLLKPPMV